MENRTTILNELKEISPVVAAIDLQQTYTVPTGYFEGLAEQVLVRVKANEEVLSATLQQTKQLNPYQVPTGYFDSLPATLLNRVKANEAQSADEELEMLSPLLNKIGKKTPFSLPAGYFEELTENSISGAQAIDFVNNELENLSPLMASLQHKQVYEAPANYFAQFPEQMLSKARAQQPAKVVSMPFRRRVMQYAAAAVVAGVLFVTGWMYLGKNGPDKTTDPIARLDKISDDVLENYIEDQTIVPAEAVVTDDNGAELNANDMKDLLADVSDADLQQYIDKYNTEKTL